MIHSARALRISLLSLAPLLAVASSASAAPPLYSPWPCGQDETVTQDHNTGSSHSDGSYDAWAWDFGMAEGEEVVAPFDGVVRAVSDDSDESCGIGGGCWKSTNHVVLAFDDGSEAQLMHLERDSSGLRVGQVVRRGEVIGRIGLSGQITAAHLHFHVQEEPCSSEPWYCKSVPASFVDLGDPQYPETVTSRNCMLDVACIVPDDASLSIDDSSSCFIDESGTATWESYDEPSDSYGFQHVTNTSGMASATGHWRFRVEQTGLYRVEVQMPWWNDIAGSASVTYEVGSGTMSATSAPVDQRANSAQWVTLGEEFLLREETESWVALSNVTPEANGTTRVGFDQVRITRIGDYVPPRCGVGQGTEIDDAGECFETTGPTWFSDERGRDGYSWSNSTGEAAPREVGTWRMEVARTEPYELWVYVPEGAETANARYRLSNGYVDLALDPVDQSARTGWVKLVKSDGTEDQAAGRFDLYAGLPASLSLGDATGEPFVGEGHEDNTVVAYDAIAIAPASQGFDPESLGDKADSTDLEDWGGSRGAADDGCTCRATPRPASAALWLALLGLGLGRRRRRA